MSTISLEQHFWCWKDMEWDELLTYVNSFDACQYRVLQVAVWMMMQALWGHLLLAVWSFLWLNPTARIWVSMLSGWVLSMQLSRLQMLPTGSLESALHETPGNVWFFVYFCHKLRSLQTNCKRTLDIFIQPGGNLGACLQSRLGEGWLVFTH